MSMLVVSRWSKGVFLISKGNTISHSAGDQDNELLVVAENAGAVCFRNCSGCHRDLSGVVFHKELCPPSRACELASTRLVSLDC